MSYTGRFQTTQPSALLLHSEKLQPSSQKNVPSGVINVGQIMWELALDFGQHCTIHGVNQMLKRKAGRYERAVWFITFLLALFGTIYVCLLLSDRFTEGKLETVIETTRFPIYRIVFPTVSICNFNMLNWHRIDEAKRLFLPLSSSFEKERLFERILRLYDSLHFNKLDEFSVLKGEPLAQLNHINFSLVADFMTWRCEELLTQCYWNRLPFKCCEVFSKRRSKNGFCWSFNTLETDEGRRRKLLDPKWPWHTGSTGPGSGLQVKVLINPDKHIPGRMNAKGINVMVSEPTVWHKEPLKVPANTNTMIIVEPVVNSHDNNTRSLGSKIRQCVFFDEQNSIHYKTLTNYPYMIENCEAECHQEYMTRFCNCSLDLLFPPGSFKPCKASDLLCLANHGKIFRFSHQPDADLFLANQHEGMKCNCFRNCYSIKYMTDTRSSTLTPEIRGNLSYVDLGVHFRFDVIMVYNTRLMFGWVDLMVAFGGIAGLFLGCSLISTMELAYFLMIYAPGYLINKFKKKVRNESIQQNLMPPYGKLMQSWNKKPTILSQRSFHHLAVHGRRSSKIMNWRKSYAMRKVDKN